MWILPSLDSVLTSHQHIFDLGDIRYVHNFSSVNFYVPFSFSNGHIFSLPSLIRGCGEVFCSDASGLSCAYPSLRCTNACRPGKRTVIYARDLFLSHRFIDWDTLVVPCQQSHRLGCHVMHDRTLFPVMSVFYVYVVG